DTVSPLMCAFWSAANDFAARKGFGLRRRTAQLRSLTHDVGSSQVHPSAQADDFSGCEFIRR
ncbi:MAG: hypothetical protein KY445_16295, partial [Armatimonadetes bacterium]|nr:hypothetical protein [Armatimonadota bacterium]